MLGLSINAQTANDENVLVCPSGGGASFARPLSNDTSPGNIITTTLDLDQSLSGIQSSVIVNGVTFNADPSGEVSWNSPGLGPNFISYTFMDDLGSTSNIGYLNVYFDPDILVSDDFFYDYCGGNTTQSVSLNDYVVGGGLGGIGYVEFGTTYPGFLMNPDGSITIASGTPVGTYEMIYTASSHVCAPRYGTVTIYVTPEIDLSINNSYVDYNADGYTSVGDIINYQYAVNNASATAINNVAITSPTAGIIGSAIPVLNAGITDNTTFTSKYIITQNDINTGAVINKTATASGTSSFGTSSATKSVSNTLSISNGIKLNAFFDTNGNGVQNAGEVNLNFGKFTYQINSGVIHNVTSSSGTHYLYESNPTTTYNLSYVLNPAFTTNYALSTSTYTSITVAAGSGITTYNFPIIASTLFNDLSIALFQNGAPPRPGFTYINRIKYTNFSNQTIPSGTVTFNCGTAVTIISTSPAITFTTTNLTYNFVNLLPFQSRYIDVTMQVPVIPVVTLGDLVANSASITPTAGDTNPLDNTSNLTQTIVGSYDPNDKVESHGQDILYSSFSSSDYLTYTIQFENTGTANAVNVRVNDLLDTKLDESSIIVIDASHPYALDRVGTNLNFRFDAIDLPPSVSGTSTGKGYVVFKIKPKPGFALGDIIPNTANIYFDFNPAIITNTFRTKFVNAISSLITAIPDVNFEQRLINLGIDDVIDGGVLTASINTLTALDVDGQNIADLTGIQDFTALTSFTCRNNQLTNLNVSSLPALNSLHCQYNLLTNLDVSGLVNLSVLVCNNNQLSSLDVSGSPILGVLECSYNLLTSLNVNGLVILGALSCNNNQLTSLNVTGLTGLRGLNCTSNLLSGTLDVSSLALVTLLCSDNPSLTCIQVSDVAAAYADIYWVKDSIAVYSLDCSCASLITTTFTAVAPICSGGTLLDLPITSNNGISGNWSPAVDNMATTTYTFTPTLGQCATTATMTILINPIETPTFTQVTPIFSGAIISPLPTNSINGITGTWSPIINNTSTTTYTFTPNSGQCATNATMTISIIPTSTVVCLPASKDTIIHEFVPTTNYGSNTILQASRWTYDSSGGTGFYTTKTLQQFNLSSIPAGAVITSAVMKLHVDTVTSPYNQHRDIGGGTGNSAIVNQVGSAWAENTVTWNTAPTILASSVAVPSLGNGSTADVVANVTAMVQNMITTGVNNGFQISLADNSDYYHSLVFGSREDLNSGGIFQPELCVTYTVPAPTPKVIPSQCGITLTSLWNTIFCTTVASATNYRFEVSNGAFLQTFDTPLGSNRCNMYDFTSISLGTTYSVRVAAKVGGLWQSFGTSCSITTPAGIPTSNVIPSQCGMTITNFWNSIFVTTVTGATGYLIELTDTVNGVRTYPIPNGGNRFNLRNFAGGGAANTVYTVRVAALYNGVYQPFGSLCTVTTSVGAVREMDTNTTSIFKVNAFPNPFTDNFKLDIETTSVNVLDAKVYDMMGRVIESLRINSSDLNSLEIGANYSSGVYNIIVTQDENVKTLRVIKK